VNKSNAEELLGTPSTGGKNDVLLPPYLFFEKTKMRAKDTLTLL
jgi:hypothetical protein